MLKKLKCFGYNPGDSLLHLVSPGLKLFLLFILVPIIFTVKTLFNLMVILSISIFALFLTGIGLKTIYRSVRPLFFLTFAAAITNFLFNPEMRAHGYLNFDDLPLGTIENALHMFFRLLSFSTLTLLFTSTTEPDGIMKALEKALSPFSRIGLPVSDYIGICTLSLSLFPMVISTSQSLFSRYLYRARRFHKNRFHRKALFCAALIAPLIMLLFKKGDEIILDRKPA